MQGQVFRVYLFLLTEFGGKGDRHLTTGDGRRQYAVGRKQESESNKRMADCGISKDE